MDITESVSYVIMGFLYHISGLLDSNTIDLTLDCKIRILYIYVFNNRVSYFFL